MVAIDPVMQAQANLKEAETQFKHGEEQFQRDEIPKERLDELGRLRDIAEEDLRRTEKVFRNPDSGRSEMERKFQTSLKIAASAERLVRRAKTKESARWVMPVAGSFV